MVQREFAASPAARSVVRAYRVVHFSRGTAVQPATKVYVPTPENCLQMQLRDWEEAEYPDGKRIKSRSVVTGAQDVTANRIVPADFLLLQVVFQPGALYQLTRIPLGELLNQYLDAECLFGRSLDEAVDRMAACSTYAGMVAIADNYMVDRLSLCRGRRLRSLLRPLCILRDNPGVTIDEMARASAMSTRQLERLCREQTGLGPREFACLSRFDRAFHVKLQRPDLDWLSVAVACGYYDYQHMSRDFRAISGKTPRQLLDTQRYSPEHLRHVPQEFDLSYGVPAILSDPYHRAGDPPT